jgi:hypothetical protein
MTQTRTRALWGVLLGVCVLAIVLAVSVLRDPLDPPAPAAASVPAPPRPAVAADIPPATAGAEIPAASAVAPSPPPPPVAATTDPNEGRRKSLHDALRETAPETARLYADFARVGKPAPPEARTLVTMKQRGASSEELTAYVRSSFPPDVLVRAVALRWLGVGVKPKQQVKEPASGGAPSLDPGGRLIRTDAR